jgi:hypothetical protein
MAIIPRFHVQALRGDPGSTPGTGKYTMGACGYLLAPQHDVFFSSTGRPAVPRVRTDFQQLQGLLHTYKIISNRS